MSVVEQIRDFWDADAATYDLDPGHHPRGELQRAAWRAALEDLLPPAPARVLDVGAGTGFVTLLAAELGHEMTAVDISPRMLARLRQKAASSQLTVNAIEADAAAVPAGPFDAVVSRHLLWTLVDPVAALAAWRAVSPHGLLVLIDRDWGTESPAVALRRLGRRALDRMRSTPPTHHGTYAPEVVRALPLVGGAGPADLLSLVAKAGWVSPRIRRLPDLDWAMKYGQAWTERLTAEAPHLAVVAAASPGSKEQSGSGETRTAAS